MPYLSPRHWQPKLWRQITAQHCYNTVSFQRVTIYLFFLININVNITTPTTSATCNDYWVQDSHLICCLFLCMCRSLTCDMKILEVSSDGRFLRIANESDSNVCHLSTYHVYRNSKHTVQSTNDAGRLYSPHNPHSGQLFSICMTSKS